ncbi:hypothetical protein QW060_03380 [Myroides ceti]|uniref:DUF6984 domain-containing protein n=1 Tax=Paenimyroides ceti TaxID=395087 RepID=A0ABT8CR70_9FLAO|nr:hypothetical protein [Paenimyroides ceti]MDN3706163.1 hypothetical protein [Paenimyroides ceti]
MELNKLRQITIQEEILLNHLINISNYSIDQNWKEKIRVKFLNDGNMGSLELFVNDDFDEYRFFGKQISECSFFDSDGVKVIVSLNIDTNGNLFELDIWKTDFSPLIKIPTDISLFHSDLN